MTVDLKVPASTDRPTPMLRGLSRRHDVKIGKEEKSDLGGSRGRAARPEGVIVVQESIATCGPSFVH